MTSPQHGPAAGWGPAPGDGGPPRGSQDLITGEAVALELRLAKLPSRALALAIDLGLLLIPLLVLGTLASVAAAGTDEALGAAIVLVSLVGVVIGYPVLFETLSRGRSPGKAAMGLRVVRDDGGPVRFRHALVRALLGLFWDFNPLLVAAPGVLISLGSAKGKRTGDMLAGTVVIRERVPTSSAPPAVMPPQLAGWAATLPVARLPDPLALEARQVLSRLDELEPEIGRALIHQLADETLVALGTAAPAGADAVSVLSAVLAERRNREMARAGMITAGPGPVAWGPPTGWGHTNPTYPHPAQPNPTQPNPNGWGQVPAHPEPMPPPQPAPAPAPAPAPEPPPAGPFALPG